MWSRRLTPCMALALALAGASAAAADWLVTRGGDRLETDGAWEVRGAMVVFTLPNGTLASLRLDEVDLDASRALTASPPPPPGAATDVTAPAAPRQPILVLTDDDVGHVDPETLESEEGETEDGDGAELQGEEGASDLQVIDWNQVDAEQGVSLVGTLANQGSAMAMNPQLRVSLYDASGALIGAQSARLTVAALAAGQSGEFRADFPSVVAFASVRFEASRIPVAATPGSSSAPAPAGETLGGEEASGLEDEGGAFELGEEAEGDLEEGEDGDLYDESGGEEAPMSDDGEFDEELTGLDDDDGGGGDGG